MEGWVFRILLKKLKIYATEYKIDVWKDNENFFILKDFNYYTIIPKKKTFYFLKIIFVDVKTYEIVKVYKTKGIYYADVIKKIKLIHKKLNYTKIEDY